MTDTSEKSGLSRLTDRCDRCGAQAFVRVYNIPTLAEGEEFVMGELLFCGHHFRKNELAFVAAGYLVEDYRETINEKPSVSATPAD